ncbi:MAG: hypothetical protein JST02_13245 [Bacteroidetes bacterium]|nr:hypothetical protein [Bacteroidota bacterium]
MSKSEAPNYNHLKTMWEYLTTKYEFKRDIVKTRILWRDSGSKTEYEVLQDEKLNTMSLNMGLQGFKSCTPANIYPFLFSEYTPTYSPIVEYMQRVGKKKPTGAIDKLAETLKTHNDKAFKKYFKKWIVASVANSLTPYGCQNHTCLTLVGGQGKGKTTWLENLCPRLLYPDYIYTGELDLGKKSDTIWKLAEYFLINIEEQIKGLNKADANTMKQLITLPHIKGRRPYGRLEATGIRVANFMASTNDEDFLTDSSGSRRYLCFKVLDIKADYKKIKMDDVWAEAFNLFNDKNFIYWISSEDIAELEDNNKDFKHVTQEHEYITQYFSVPNDKHPATHIAPSTAIRDFIKQETFNQVLKERNVGIALKSLGYEQISYRFEWTHNPIKGWAVHLNKDTKNSLFTRYAKLPF